MIGTDLHLPEPDGRPAILAFGWAPGTYLNTCFECNARFQGEKQSHGCAACAYRRRDQAAELMERFYHAGFDVWDKAMETLRIEDFPKFAGAISLGLVKDPNGSFTALMIRKLSKQALDLLDGFEDLLNQACGDGEKLNSMARSSYAGAIRMLAQMGRVKITKEFGRVVEAEWVTQGGT